MEIASEVVILCRFKVSTSLIVVELSIYAYVICFALHTSNTHSTLLVKAVDIMN